MRYLKEMIAVLILLLMVFPASAIESYEVELTILRPNDMNDLDNTTWSVYDTFTIIMGETITSVHKIEILDVSITAETIFIEVIKDGDRYTDYIKLDEERVFGEEDELDFKIRLDDIDENGFSSSTTTIGDEDDVVKVWIAPNTAEQLALTKDPRIPDAYNPSEFGKTGGWSGAGSVEYVVLYIERLEQSSGIAISVDGGDWDEKTTDGDARKFELNENAVYTITVDYETVDKWGGVNDETEIYMLSLTGLLYGTNTGSTSTNTLSTDYTDTVLDTLKGTVDTYIIFETDSDGAWEEIDGMTTKFDAELPNGDYSWKIKFDSAGTHEVGFSGTDGSSGYFKFVVKEKTPVPSATVAAQQTTTNEDKESNAGTIVLLIGALILIAASAIYMNRKNKAKNSGNSRLSPEPEA